MKEFIERYRRLFIVAAALALAIIANLAGLDLQTAIDFAQSIAGLDIPPTTEAPQ